MKVEPATRYAVVIEPHHSLAGGVADRVRKRGYVVGIAATHASGAAWAASRAQIDLVVTSVPALTENSEGTYLAKARSGNPDIRILVMLSSQDEHIGNAPRHAGKIEKPFSLLELEDAIDRALAEPASSRPP